MTKTLEQAIERLRQRLHTTLPLWSVRISDSYRAVGVRGADDSILYY